MKIKITQEFDLKERKILQSLINQNIINFGLNEYENKNDFNEFYSFSPSAVNLALQSGDNVLLKNIHLFTMPELETQQLGLFLMNEINKHNFFKISIDFTIKKIEIYSKPLNEDFDYLYAREVFNKYLPECDDHFFIIANTCQMIVLYNENNHKISIEATQYNGSSICLSLNDELVDKKINKIYPIMSNPDYANKLQYEFQYTIE